MNYEQKVGVCLQDLKVYRQMMMGKKRKEEEEGCSQWSTYIGGGGGVGNKYLLGSKSHSQKIKSQLVGNPPLPTRKCKLSS